MVVSRQTPKIIIALVFLCGVIAVVLMLTSREKLSRGFPIPEVGAYAGVVNMPNPATLYLERLRQGDTLLLIVFTEGFQPQSLFPERLLRVEGEELYRPLVIRVGEGSLRLSGIREKSGRLYGRLKTNKGESGEWWLTRVDPAMLSRGGTDLNELSELLKVRDLERISQRNVQSVRNRKVEVEERIVNLERALSDQAALKARASRRRDTLERELKEKTATISRLAKSVDELAGELELLARISRRGQAVSLERRILQREHRWYEVNWSDEEFGQAELPDAGIDLVKFNQAVRQAQETRTLLRERDDELRRLRELESAPGTAPENMPPATEQEGLWNRLFG
jgi:hypothetical protein